MKLKASSAKQRVAYRVVKEIVGRGWGHQNYDSAISNAISQHKLNKVCVANPASQKTSELIGVSFNPFRVNRRSTHIAIARLL